MEENSESRSDRLKAMRAIAADASVGLPAPPGLLANPMLDGPSETETTTRQGGGPRFDFYTDPMAAFSSTRNRNPPLRNPPPGNFIPPAGRGPPPPAAWVPPSPPPGPWNPTPRSTPPYMQGHHHPVDQGMYQANSPYGGGGGSPYGSQGGIRSPFPFQQGSPRPQAWSEFADPAAHYGSGPRPRYQGNPNYAPARSPIVNHGQGNAATWVGNAHRPNSGYRGHQFPSSGRGQGGRWHRGSGRGRGFQNRDSTSSGRQDPWRFYHDSMVEDPWKGLRPIEWRGITAGSSGSWMPSSISAKRPRGPVSSFNQSSDSGQSLADYLASSFNEASNAEQNT